MGGDEDPPTMPSVATATGSNEMIARALDELGELVGRRDAQPFRAASYHHAATVVRHLPAPITTRYVEGGTAALDDLPGVGPGIARIIEQLIETGRSTFLERLRAKADDDHESSTTGPFVEPAISELLDVDREYRTKAAADRLPRLAPRRFNPTRKPWLPVLHTARSDRKYTALFANTARAHELRTTHDWVILRIRDHGREHLITVETETRGPLTGQRVIRGREWECLTYYGRQALPATPGQWPNRLTATARRPRLRDTVRATAKVGAEPPWLAAFKAWQHQQFHTPASLVASAAPTRPARDPDERVGRSVERG
jgi:hypothetical protein